ncbi:MAG: tetratricopeptide repeat protein [Chromatiales bacterium]|nr:tetratricopeptide repeat protein [Chromatiales bacterium]
MLQWWVLLSLPVAAASGWYAAIRYYKKKYLTNRPQDLRQVYVRGLNYLLSEKTDQAIDTFAHLLVSDIETIETHIALGNLFRRRGEIERAIEIHEKLIDQDDLECGTAASAHFELGRDYLHAGLFDRAEGILSNLTDHPSYRKAALQQLLLIYQQEKEWQKAMECARELKSMGKVLRGETAAQFLCEMAEEALQQGLAGDGITYLQRALREDPRCIRATLLTARIQMRSGRFDQALRTLKKVESQDSAYIPEILEPLGVCHERLHLPAEELHAYLSHLYESFGCEDAAVYLAEHLETHKSVGQSDRLPAAGLGCEAVFKRPESAHRSDARRSRGQTKTDPR